MKEIDISTITKRSIRGVFALTSRTFVIQLITFVTNFFLTIFLSPEIFGIFFIVSAAVVFFTYFSDIGLAAALIQKKEPLTEKDLRTTFTIQQFLVISMVSIALIFSQSIGDFYKFNQEGVFLFQALAIAFFLSSLKTIPSIILERQLRFEKLVIPQIAETIVFSSVVVYLAVNGYGVTSFTYAVLARGAVGLVAMYIIAPWKVGFAFSKSTAKKLLSFGIPFQTNSFLALVKDDLLIIYLGKVLPLAQVGYIGFAQKWAFTPLRLIMDNIIRITFPSYSRLQDEKEILGRAIEKSLLAVGLFVFPALMGLVILTPYFIEIIPRYGKWEPAVLSLMFFSINAAFSSISTPLTNALNAIGKIKITLYLMVFWTALTWIATPLAIVYLGFNGVAIASAFISLSVFIVIAIVKRYVSFKVWRSINIPIFATLGMGLFLFLIAPIIVINSISLIAAILAGGVVYFLIILAVSRKTLFSNISMLKENLKK
ncbi:oligosaccharide flippase family protein [Patescibacteria group bacterium]|nr:oligosaccharide flippase family protein [Patescibacteria group bacterium]